MAFNVSFDGDKANQWIDDLKSLNDSTDELLKRVSTTLNQVKNSGSGQLVDNMMKVANGLTIGFTALMQASTSLADKFGDILKTFKNTVTDITSSINTAAQGMFGGGSKSIKDTKVF